MESLEGTKTTKVAFYGKSYTCRGKRVKHCWGKGKARICRPIPHVYCSKTLKAAKPKAAKPKAAKPKVAKPKVAKGWTAARKKAFVERMAAAKASKGYAARARHAELYPQMDGVRSKRRR